MKAIVCSKAGGPEVLEMVELDAPVPGEREVLIDVHAAALNRADLLQRRGLYPPPPGTSPVLGMECAGVVCALGPGISAAKLGDRVMALLPAGGYAERVAVNEQLLLPIPPSLDFVNAAAIPEAFLTSSEALFALGRTQPGEWVLIHAAASGVGSAAVQLARLAGARVIATTSDKKVDAVRALGPERVVARETEDFAAVALELTGGRGVDVIIDLVGASYLAKHLECLAVLGRHVVVGLVGGAKAEIDLGRVLSRRLSLLGIVMRSRSLADKIGVVERFRRQWLHRLDDGSLRPLVDRVFSFEHVADAHRYMESNANVGKIVLKLHAAEPRRAAHAPPSA
ncbi:MAG TPA: NAD(P)H-quinone oxidoreductase [Polyangiaceae bacterium]|nr:NAD(P)H-quinone oxidoreductase [Polyangiaceae bacterium]